MTTSARKHQGVVPEPVLTGTLWDRPEDEQDGKPFDVMILRPASYIGPQNPTPEQVLMGGRLRYPGIKIRDERWERWRILAQDLDRAKDVVRRKFARIEDHRWLTGEGVEA